MKYVMRFWNNRSDYEKVVLGLFAGFALFCLGYFSNGLYLKWKCAVCGQPLRKGEHYILDVRTGEIQSISDYVEKESDVFWVSEVSGIPQEASAANQAGYMRFPRQAPATARYCANHTANLDTDFLVLSPLENVTVCYAIWPGENLDPEGRIIIERRNEGLDCWELEIHWDSITPASSP